GPPAPDPSGHPGAGRPPPDALPHPALRTRPPVTRGSPRPDRGAVALEHLGLVLVPRRGRPVRVQHQGPAPPVDYHLVVEAADKHAVAPAPAAAGVPRRHPGLPQRRPITYGAEHDGLDPF